MSDGAIVSFKNLDKGVGKIGDPDLKGPNRLIPYNLSSEEQLDIKVTTNLLALCSVQILCSLWSEEEMEHKQMGTETPTKAKDDKQECQQFLHLLRLSTK
jgi:hypothetical protein